MERMDISQLGKPIASGFDSQVYKHSDPNSLLKVYYGLHQEEIRRYHRIHANYATRGLAGAVLDPLFQQYAELKGLRYMYLGQEVLGMALSVLDLDEKNITHNGDHVCTQVPYIQGENLLNYWNVSLGSEEELASRQLTGHAIELMAHRCLEGLEVPLEKRDKDTKEIVRKGHTIGRENIMLQGINEDGIIEATVTDLGIQIRHAIAVEMLLDGQI